MANFEESFKKTMGAEGNYDFDPVDVGGETYKGITRKYEPDWVGWKIIEKYTPAEWKNSALLNSNTELQSEVKKLYKQKYWNVFLGDSFPSQLLANEMFDTGVNLGTKDAIQFLQIALNVLNKNKFLWEDLVDDGVYGSKTGMVLSTALKDTKNEVLIYKIMNILQGNHYIEYMGKSPIQEKFARGWFDRVDFVKK